VIIISGGNFHGQPCGLDFMAIALAELEKYFRRKEHQLISGL
jgi:histidine ammonia-lyase